MSLPKSKMPQQDILGVVIVVILFTALITFLAIQLYNLQISNEKWNEEMLDWYLKESTCTYLQNNIKEYDDYILRSPPNYITEAEKIKCQQGD